jgi:nucleoside phosphorylase
VVIRGVSVPPGRVLLSRLQATTIEPLPYQVHFGQMVSSATLVDSPEYRTKIKYLVPHAIGGDMEGAAIYAAAATNGIEWIVVKGISDQGQDKSYAPQPRAAANAADFVVRTLQLGGLVDITETALPGER